FSVNSCFEFGRCQPLSESCMITVCSGRLGVTLAAQVPVHAACGTSNMLLPVGEMQCGSLARARYFRISRIPSSIHQTLPNMAKTSPKLVSFIAVTVGGQDEPVHRLPRSKSPPSGYEGALPNRYARA